MTAEEHIEKHKALHKAFDELLADFIIHNPDHRLSTLRVMELVEWSHSQTVNPTEKIDA